MPVGGAVGGDAYTIAIAHREDGCYILDWCAVAPVRSTRRN